MKKTLLLFLVGLVPLCSFAQLSPFSVELDGTNDIIDFGTSSTLRPVDSFSVEAWVYPTDLSGASWAHTILGSDVAVAGNNQGFAFRCGDGGDISFVIGNGGGWPEVQTTSDPLSLNTWNHVAATYDGTNILVYVNGQLVGTAFVPGSAVASTISLAAGRSGFAGREFDGRVDDMRMWSTVRTQAQIQANACDTLVGTEAGLLAYWQMDEGTGTAIADKTTGGNNGTLTNANAATAWVSGFVCPNTAGIAAITSPTTACGLGMEQVTVEIGNNGGQTITSVNVFLSINGGTAMGPYAYTTGIPSFSTATFTLPPSINMSTPGVYDITAYTVYTGDTDASDDTLTVSVTNIPLVNSFPYNESFATGPGGWVSGGTNSSWELRTPANATINSAASDTNSWITNATGFYNGGEDSWVLGPCFDFSSLLSPYLKMSVWWNSEFSWDGAVLQTSIDSGMTWQNVGANGDPFNWYNDNSINGMPGGSSEGWTGRGFSGSGGWVTAEHALDNLGGQSAVLMRVAFGSDGFVSDDGFAFDDIEIFELPPIRSQALGVPQPFSGCGLTMDTVALTYTNIGTSTFDSTAVYYSINGGTPVMELDTTTLMPGDTTTYQFATLANLSTVGVYNIRVWLATPGDTDNGDDTTGTVITHIPTLNTFPYFEDFENGPGGWVAGGTNSSWQLGTPNNTVIIGAASGSNAWVTDTVNDYNGGEDSWILGPCFDMSSMLLPIFRAKIWWNSEFSWDGAVLQSSIDGGQTWQRIGNAGDPNNWYNDTTINGNPGGQQHGWTGRGTTGSGGWVTAEHNMVTLGGQSSVLLRIAFGSDGFVSDDGFAIDDIEVFESPPVDARALAIVHPVTTCGLGMDTVKVSYFNAGTASFDSAVVSYSINGATYISEIDTQTVNGGDTVTYCFATLGNFTALGPYTVDANIFIASDMIKTDDSLSVSITHIPQVSSFPYNEDFENGPGGWTAVNNANGKWQLGTPNGNVIVGAASGINSWVTDTTGTYNTNDDSWVISPCFDMSSLLLPNFRFSIWWDSENSWDGTVLQSTVDDGASWQNVGNLNDPNNWFNDGTINGNPGGQSIGWTGSPGSGGWVTAEHSIPNLAGQPKVRFRVAFGSDGSVVDDGFAFDDVEIYESPPVDANVLSIIDPTSGCGITMDTVTFQYSNLGTTAFDSTSVFYSINGGTPVMELDTNTVQAGDTTTYSFTTLANLGTVGPYLITVWTVHPDDTTASNDTLSILVQHIPIVTSYPYFEDFETWPGGWVPQSNGANNSWEWGLPRGNTIDTAASGVKAWMTDTLDNYLTNEDSWVLSPCYDFSSLLLPQIKMNIWWNSENGWDGAVLQSTVDSGMTWVNVGAFGDPDNWYNDASINGNPGGQGEGWSGRFGAGSGGWVLAEHKMATLAGEPDVRFRIAFGSDGSITDDGFAFDDVEISEVQPNDLGSLGTIVPSNNSCADSFQAVHVVIKNFGSAAQNNFPVTVVINGTQTLTTTYPDTLQSEQTDTVFVGYFNSLAGGSYDFTSYTDLSTDQTRSNDTTMTLAINIIPAPPAPGAAGVTLCGPDSAMLRITMPDTGFSYNWYDDVFRTNLLLQDSDSFQTPFVSANDTFFVGQLMPGGGVMVTEAELGGPDYMEIQNTSSQPVNVTGWTVWIGEDGNASINDFEPTSWNLSGTMGPGDIRWVDDAAGSGANYFGTNILWNPSQEGWILILDNNNDVVDFVVWGWSAADLANFGPTINSTTISITNHWSGAPATINNSNIRRIGNTDHDDATDWATAAANFGGKGTLNPGLNQLFAGCESPLRAVPVVIAPPVPVDLGPDRAACAGVILDATFLGGASYLWNTNDTTAMLQVQTSGQYVVTVTNTQGCVGTDTLNLLIQPSPSVDLGPDTTACGMVDLDAGNPGSSYAWCHGPQSQVTNVNTSGQYCVVVTNVQGCDATDTVNVTILPTPQPNLGPDVSECSEATLDAGAGGSSYLWNTNDTTQMITVTTTGQYTVTVSDTNGCEGSDDIIVSILPNPVVDLGPDTLACDMIVLDAGNAGATYMWDDATTNQTRTITTSGQYYVDVLDQNGCAGTDTVNVTVEPSPVADFTSFFTSALTAQFTNLGSSGPGFTYLWDFGDMNTSTLENPTHTYNFVGNYIVTLTISSPNCGDATADIRIGTNLEDELFGNSIALFPNPTNGAFVIGINGLEAGQLSITVTDLTGREIYRHAEDHAINGNYEHMIDLSEHAEGVYYVTITDGERKSRKKLVRK